MLFYEIFSDVKIGGVDIGIIIAITLFLILLIQISNLTRQSIEKDLTGISIMRLGNLAWNILNFILLLGVMIVLLGL